MSVPTVTNLLPYLGEEVTSTYDRAQVVILPIPYEATTTYRRGCENGPDAILTASHQVEYYDEELDREVCYDIGIYTHTSIADTRNQTPVSAEAMLEITTKTVYEFVADGKFVISLGGEHSITEGVVAAYKKAFPDELFTVIQIDAHGDLRQEYQGSIHNHACVMRRILDLGLPTIQIGIRSICKEEADLIKAQNLTVFRARDIAMHTDWIAQAIAAIKTKKVFLTIDLDGLDPTLIPGVGTPEPGGLNWYSFMTFLKKLFTEYQVIGSDIMELAPVTDAVVSEFTAAKLAYKLIGYQAEAQGW